MTENDVVFSRLFPSSGQKIFLFCYFFIPGTQFGLQKAPPDPSGEQPKKSTICGKHFYQILVQNGLPKGARRKTIDLQKHTLLDPNFLKVALKASGTIFGPKIIL